MNLSRTPKRSSDEGPTFFQRFSNHRRISGLALTPRADTVKSDTGAQLDDLVNAAALQIAGWTVHPMANRMHCGSDTVKLEPKVMRVLVYLANRHGQTVTRDALTGAVWSGTIVGDDAVTNAIIKLRKAFGDDSRSPKVIETIPNLG